MTAVEWFNEQIEQYILTHGNLPFNVLSKFNKQAKEMEKNQIIGAYQKGRFNYEDWNKGIKKNLVQSEQFYNETYGSKGSDETKVVEFDHIKTNDTALDFFYKRMIPFGFKLKQSYRDIIDHFYKQAKQLEKTHTSSQTEISDEPHSTITDKIDGMIFELPFDDKMKLWELIDELVAESQTEISDEEIEKWASNHIMSGAEYFGRVLGAKWYREQLKKKQ